jgi:hypothetical protein
MPAAVHAGDGHEKSTRYFTGAFLVLKLIPDAAAHVAAAVVNPDQRRCQSRCPEANSKSSTSFAPPSS